MNKFGKFFFLVIFIVFVAMAAGCSATHYGGEGLLAGAATAGSATALGTGGHPVATGAATVLGGVVGYGVGKGIPKPEGVEEQAQAIEAKRKTLREEDQRFRYNEAELELRIVQICKEHPDVCENLKRLKEEAKKPYPQRYDGPVVVQGRTTWSPYIGQTPYTPRPYYYDQSYGGYGWAPRSSW